LAAENSPPLFQKPLIADSFWNATHNKPYNSRNQLLIAIQEEHWMKLGFDIDGVIANFADPLIRTVKKNYGLQIKESDITSFDINIFLGITKAEEKQLIEEILSGDLPLYGGAKETIEQLSKEGHSIYLLTGRWSHMRDLTQTWLKEKDIAYTELHLLPLGKKYQVNVEGLDVIVEDSLEEALEWTTKVKNVLVFDRPWNQSLNVKGLTRRVHSWKEIYHKIQQLNSFNSKQF
jgi:uncharacterized HAD superfamily protein